jgi:hypothetical protein
MRFKKKTTRKSAPHAKKGNPFFSTKARKHGRGRRRTHNPEIGKSAGAIVKNGFLALLGLVATRQLPQYGLGANNTGWKGYLANIAVVIAATWAATKMLGKDAGMAVGIGGSAYVVDRVLSENFSVGDSLLSLSGYGDFNAHVKTFGLGQIRDRSFFSPECVDSNGQLILPSAVTGYVNSAIAASQVPVPAQSRMAGLRAA